ncbi:PadR family transcriptional regulator [Acidobacteriota bacterium]
MKELTVLEQIILASIFSLDGDAYGVAIRKRVKSLTGKNLMYGTLYNALDQLRRKGYILKAKSSKPDEGREKRGRVYYSLSPSGKKALRSAHRLQKTIWDSIPDLIKDRES